MNPPGTLPDFAVLFDLDGTLVDTLEDITDTMNEVLLSADLPSVSRQKMRLLVGEGLTNLIAKASGVHEEEHLGRLVDQYKSLYARNMLNMTALYRGISDVLDTLVKRGVRISVLSNKPHVFTAPIGKALLSNWPFVRIEGAGDKYPRKPDPAFARCIADSMDCSCHKTYFVGDSDVDIATARNTGMISVAVTWGFRDASTLQSADHVVSSPAQLLHLFQLD